MGSGYDAWLERPYVQAAKNEAMWEAAEEEAERRGEGWDAEAVVEEWTTEIEAGPDPDWEYERRRDAAWDRED